jgi:hypothetical protein
MNRLKQNYDKLKQWFLYYVVVRNCKLIMLYDDNVVAKEWTNPQRYYRCLLGGLIWKIIPDLTFCKRRYLIVDY